MESWTRSALYEVAQSSREAIGESPGALFLTLCSVPTPISLPEPKSSMQRFRFFFTRQVESGIERCWLHFGYFRTVEEARKWRELLCRVYPAAAIRVVPKSEAPQSGAASDNLSDSQVLSLLDGSAGAVKKPVETVASAPQRRESTLA
jgi:hypothetical protein